MNEASNHDLIDLADALGPDVPEAPSRRELREWDLVLTAMNIPHRVVSVHGEYHLLVEAEQKNAAAAQIRSYIRENIPRPEPVRLPDQGRPEPTFFVLLLLFVFTLYIESGGQGLDPRYIPWHELGRVDAGAVFDGEWWRLATGLTLHADPGHLLGNLVIGGYFIMTVCRRIGSGPGWLLVILTGILGNGVNVWVRGAPHYAVGASTAVFGAVGLLGGLRVLEARRGERFHKLLPVAAGLGLLAFLGTGGERTDLGAHLFGFVTGVLLGLAGMARLRLKGPFSRWLEWGAAIVAAVPIPLAWWMAVRFGHP